MIIKNTLQIALYIVFAHANNCGGNCPSNSCTNCLCGSTKNIVDISSWCAQYSGWSQTCCQCIAEHESGGNANAQNENRNGSIDIGLWQINSVNWNSCSGGSAPCDPTTNLSCAKKIWAWGGNSWRYWVTCSKCGCCSKDAEDMFLRREHGNNVAVQHTVPSFSYKFESIWSGLDSNRYL